MTGRTDYPETVPAVVPGLKKGTFPRRYIRCEGEIELIAQRRFRVRRCRFRFGRRTETSLDITPASVWPPARQRNTNSRNSGGP